MKRLHLLIRALRLPFTTTSALPFIYGALLSAGPLRWAPFVFGLVAVMLTHLSANVINDYTDTRLGADTHDPKHYGFFGGSKVITEGLMSARQVLMLAIGLAAIAVTAVVSMAAVTRRPTVLLIYAGILTLGWAYSCPPFKLSYRGLGELTIGVLFGGATVIGGGYSTSGILFDASLVLPAAVHGSLVMAILFANEVADAANDAAADKRTLIVRVGARHGWIVFLLAVLVSLACIVAMVVSGQVGPCALFALASLVPAVRATRRLRDASNTSIEMLVASRAAIGTHTIAAVALILERWT